MFIFNGDMMMMVRPVKVCTVGLKSIFPRHHVALRSRFGCWLNHHQGGPAGWGGASS